MFDSDTLRPVIIAMVLYLIAVYMTPELITQPTKVKVIDDFVMYLLSQKGFVTSGVILIGLIMYLTNYINNSML